MRSHRLAGSEGLKYCNALQCNILYYINLHYITVQISTIYYNILQISTKFYKYLQIITICYGCLGGPETPPKTARETRAQSMWRQLDEHLARGNHMMMRHDQGGEMREVCQRGWGESTLKPPPTHYVPLRPTIKWKNHKYFRHFQNIFNFSENHKEKPWQSMDIHGIFHFNPFYSRT